MQIIQVRYWAAAKAAAGVAGEDLPTSGPLRLDELREQLIAAHPDSRFADVVAICSVLIDDRPVGSVDPGSVLVQPGQSVEFLPPFAGG